MVASKMLTSSIRAKFKTSYRPTLKKGGRTGLSVCRYWPFYTLVFRCLKKKVSVFRCWIYIAVTVKRIFSVGVSVIKVILSVNFFPF